MPQWVSNVADIIGVLGGVFAFLAWIQTLRLRKYQIAEQKRLNSRIRVVLQYEDEKYELPFPLRRSEFTRAELLGRLGMVPIKNDESDQEQKRFLITYLNSRDFFEQMNRIVQGEGDDLLVVPCEWKEFNQFDLPSIP
ncbi:MAG: hypothetical protein KPEEDBHJ_01229 [Anaerolineales bacterium]|nr:hypothetical protein [Anaerolineales bacterium]